MKQAAAWVSHGMAIALSIMPLSVLAQKTYPEKPIRLVVGFPPGGGADTIARPVTQKLSSQMSATIVIQNKDGASGNIAADYVSKSNADGYTLLFLPPNQVVSIAFEEKLGYDLRRDLIPVASLTTSPYYVIAHPAVSGNTPAEFAAYLKSAQGKVAYGSSGNGSTGHLSVLLFLSLVPGASPLHVPYKGGSQAHTDLLAGRIQFMIQSISSSLPMVRQKRLKVIANGGLKRSDVLPDVPTISETLMPGFQLGTWYGVMAPAKTPPAIVNQLNREINKVLRDADLRSQLNQIGSDTLESTPEQFGAHIRSEIGRFTKVVKDAGVKTD